MQSAPSTTPSTYRQPVVCSDFDGTITERDVIAMVFEAFGPIGWRDVVRQMLKDRTLSIRQGFSHVFRHMTGSHYDAIHRFVLNEVRLRPGVRDTVAWCHAHGVPFMIVSGGLDSIIHAIMHREGITHYELYSNRALYYADRIEVINPWANADCAPCGRCGCCKLDVMDRYPAPAYYRLVVGDSLTDWGACQRADEIFATGHLIDLCQEANLPHTTFQTFDPLLTRLQALVATPQPVPAS